MKILSIISTFIFVVTAHSFTLSNNSSVKGWKDGEVTFVVNTANCPAGVDVIKAIKDAAEIWNQVPTSSLKVKYGGTTTATTDGDPIVVRCSVNFSGDTGGADEDGTVGVARANGTDRLASGQMILNASTGDANIANVSKKALDIVVTHEMGHALGLGHSQSTSAVMYYTYSFKTDLNLTQDDIDGISYLYPKDEFDDNMFAGCGLVSSQLPPTGPMYFLFLSLILLLPLLVYLKLKSKLKILPQY